MGGATNHLAGRSHLGGVGGVGNHLGMPGHGLGVGGRPGLNSGAHPNYGRYSMHGQAGMHHPGGAANGLNRGFGHNGLNGNRPGLNSGLARGGAFNNSFNHRINNITSINNTRNISQTSFNGRGGFGGYGHGGYRHNWMHGRWGGYGGYGGYGGWGYGRGGYGGWGGYGGYGGWGYGGFWPGLGFGLGYGLGLGGWGLGYGGLGLGGWGLGYGLGWGGLGYGGWGYGGYGGLGWGGYGGYGGWGYGGWGLSPWLYGPSLYNWGYSSFYNPYVSSVVVTQPVVYDYTQPIDTLASASVTPSDSATSNFDQAREAFKAGSYTKALDLTDLAIRDLPNDATLHEFRALCLFALGRYNEAATTLYAVLAVGPGWDWATLASLYPNVSEYTTQLRNLEAAISRNPESAPARFVLAYHYLTENHPEAAAQQLRQVVKLQPKDTLSSQLLQQLQPGGLPGGSASAEVPAPGNPKATGNSNLPPLVTGREGRLEGTWTASPAPDTTITLSFVDGDRFNWTVSHEGKPQQKMEGTRTFGRNILTLAQTQGPALVGNITWQDETHFNLKVPGAASNDPGLSFSKSD
jgi:hypothetical protein